MSLRWKNLVLIVGVLFLFFYVFLMRGNEEYETCQEKVWNLLQMVEIVTRGGNMNVAYLIFKTLDDDDMKCYPNLEEIHKRVKQVIHDDSIFVHIKEDRKVDPLIVEQIYNALFISRATVSIEAELLASLNYRNWVYYYTFYHNDNMVGSLTIGGVLTTGTHQCYQYCKNNNFYVFEEEKKTKIG